MGALTRGEVALERKSILHQDTPISFVGGQSPKELETPFFESSKLFYVKYRDHVFLIRETVGWFNSETALLAEQLKQVIKREVSN
jgi:hypothetical protein